MERPTSPADDLGFGAYYDPFAYSWGFDYVLYWGGPGWFCYPWHERWWRDHPGERWGSHRWWGPGGFEHAHDIRGHFADGRDRGFHDGGHDSRERMPGAVHNGAGWNNIYARDGNAARNVSATRQRSATPARAVTSPEITFFPAATVTYSADRPMAGSNTTAPVGRESVPCPMRILPIVHHQL